MMKFAQQWQRHAPATTTSAQVEHFIHRMQAVGRASSKALMLLEHIMSDRDHADGRQGRITAHRDPMQSGGDRPIPVPDPVDHPYASTIPSNCEPAR